ncbi:HyaD/HybD family hydrogenase maturation endopeptidase [Parabacteroides pacaensis]|uniref:HyaD/HybD family hydrogenase maturation endopeptidase n=1 Tax=Parabacteroides pacaensis TaxID=2086575 RepID=UPI000D0FC32F|nr:HyaD/HybD family hydrogenase maturation endopeptidase [Parabacteroides pacaensis]
MDKTLILGVGNVLLTDEGVGIHAIYALEKESWPEHVSLLDGGTGGIHLTGDLQEYDTIIMIDATLDDDPPGTIRLLRPRRALDFPPLMSAHEIGLQDMITVMVLTDKLPDIHLITVSVKNINSVRIGLSPEIQESIPKVVKLVKKLIADLSVPKQIEAI